MTPTPAKMTEQMKRIRISVASIPVVSDNPPQTPPIILFVSLSLSVMRNPPFLFIYPLAAKNHYQKELKINTNGLEKFSCQNCKAITI
jgi:hypothetical protein